MPPTWAILLASLAAWGDEPEPPPADPDEQFWPAAADTAPSETDALDFVARVLDRLAEGSVDRAWLRQHFRPAHLPVVPERWYTTLHYTLEHGTLGRALRDAAPPLTVVEGPDYQRVVLPHVSLVVRGEASALVVDRIEPVTCVTCSEPERFVSDLLAAYRRPDPGHRLVPTVDLAVASDDGRSARSHWLAAMETRNRDGGGLRALLDGAVIDKAVGREVVLTYADGRTDTWTLAYERGVWRLDLDALPPESPLHLSSDSAERWRLPSTVEAAARERWQPPWTSRDGGLLIGTSVIGAHFDPFDDTVIATAFERDRSLSAVFRVDVDRRSVAARWPVPIDRGNPLPTQDWYPSWHTALSADGERLAVTQNTRLYVLDLASGATELVLRPRAVRALAWSSDDELLVGERWGNLYALAEPWHRAWIEPPALALDRRQGQLRVLAATGELFSLDDGIGTASPWGRACCGAPTGASFHPDGSRVLVQCGPTCASAAELVDWPGSGSIAVAGSSGTWDATSFSPNGRWFTTHSADRGVIVWDLWTQRPVRRLGEGDVRAVRWSAHSDRLLLLGTDGELWYFDLGEAPDPEPDEPSAAPAEGGP